MWKNAIREIKMNNDYFAPKTLMYFQYNVSIGNLFFLDLLTEEKSPEMFDIETGDTFSLNGHHPYDIRKLSFPEEESVGYFPGNNEKTPSFIDIEL